MSSEDLRPSDGQAVQPRPNDGTLALLVVEALKAQPRGTEPLAGDLARRPSDVRRVCRALAKAGRIGRDGRVWRVLQPAARCAGVNSLGGQCGREAALGSEFCTLHQDQSEPTKPAEEKPQRGPMKRYEAVNIINFLERNDPGRVLPTNTGADARDCSQAPLGVHVGALDQLILEQRRHIPEARRVLERDDPEWLEKHDAGTLTVQERHCGVTLSALRKRLAAQAERPARVVDIQRPVVEDDGVWEEI